MLVSDFLLFWFQELPDFLDLSAVLIWLVAGGTSIAVQYMLSILAELWPGWHNLSSVVKFLISLLVALLLSLGANWLLAVPALVAAIQPIWFVIVSFILTWTFGQKALAWSNTTGYNKRAKGR